MKYILPLLALLFTMPMLAAADAVAVAESDVIFQNDHLSTILDIVLSVLGLVATWIGGKGIQQMRKRGFDEETIDQISTATTRVYHDFVKTAKAAAKDGKLSKAEAADARSAAIQHVMDGLKGGVKRYVIKRGTPWITSKIEDVISAKKGK